MKLVMINDCAYVGETLIKYLPPQVDAVHLKRSRGFWEKTFGIASKISKAKADVFHVHYLLQDCYLALKFGKKPVIGHAHGSDLRRSLKHPLWGRIVRYNLKNCDKVLVSTPDVLRLAKAALREDAVYLPNPVNAELFYPKPFSTCVGRKRVLIASDSNWRVKGTDIAVKALAQTKEDVDISIIGHGIDFGRTLTLASSLGLRLNVLPTVPHERMNEYYWSSDLVIDQFKLGALGMIALEAIACGRPVITYISSEYLEYKDFPLKDMSTEEDISNVMSYADVDLLRKENAYLRKNHDPHLVTDKLCGVYKEVGS